ncbi:MAG: hypothetical protein OXL96_28145 [Candidatus Poribacteria bacterium]|nr:hypothetical protein [Candidatus Poribacteria bacterium]
MNVADLQKAQESLVGAVLDLDAAVEGLRADNRARESIEGYQRTIQGVVGELSIQIARSTREEKS